MRTLPAHAAAYLSAYPAATPAQLAAALNLTPQTARNYRARAIRAGIAKPLRPRLDLDEMRELIEDGARTEDAARHLGISRNALRLRLSRADTPVSVVRLDTVFSAADVARIIGVAAPTARDWLRRWREQRLIRCRIGRRHGSPWRIAVLDWMAFLERPNCPLDPARITDAEWRAYTAEWRERRAQETR